MERNNYQLSGDLIGGGLTLLRDYAPDIYGVLSQLLIDAEQKSVSLPAIDVTADDTICPGTFISERAETTLYHYAPDMSQGSTLGGQQAIPFNAAEYHARNLHTIPSTERDNS